ncbi:hypothetical protein [Cellulomonas composti]|uniref:Uncharacterized protein n=1 Tax=Cellulomonas composti TaxID=266130 RepID=A0A511JCG2_9CELL|nr:hypothetical protein [Cellulomonas composti]GEL95393.1 hypothetical protein CCO02nite_20510 [Cellulomonas composti]
MSAATCAWCDLSAPGPRYPAHDSDGEHVEVCTDCAIDDPDFLDEPGDGVQAALDLARLWDGRGSRGAQMDWLRRRVEKRHADRIVGDVGPQAMHDALVAVLDLLDDAYERDRSSVTALQVRNALHGALS